MTLERVHVSGRRVLILVGIAVALAAPAAAQKPTFDIEGVVSDAQQGVLPGATVTLRNVATGLAREITTDANGRYVFASLPPGQYVLQTALSGFATERRENLTFNAGQRAIMNVTLRLSAVQETVTVTGDSPIVQTTSAEVTKTIESRDLTTLPVAERNYFRLLTLDSNVVARSPGTNGLYVGGGDVWNFGTYVDGTSNFSKWLTLQRAPQRGSAGFALETVAEVQIITNQFSAEFGGHSAGVMNMITKSGSNAYAGAALLVVRPGDLDAIPPLATQKVPFNQQQFGGNLGGPLVHDRAFFFGSYEQRRERSQVSVTSPASPGTVIPTPADEYQGHARGDIRFSPSQSLAVRYNMVRWQQDNEAGGLQLPGTGYIWTNNVDTIQNRLTSVASDRLLNEVRAQWSRYYDLRKAKCDCVQFNRAGYSIEGGVATGTWGVIPEDTWDFSDTISLWRGAHSFKMGGGVTYDVTTQRYLPNQNGVYNFAGGPAVAPNPNLFTQAFALVPGQDVLYPKAWVFSGFAQDEWRLARNLTLNYGLRYDYYTPLRERDNLGLQPVLNGRSVRETLLDPNGTVAFVNGGFYKKDIDNFGPSVGFAWDPFKDGRTSIRGGYSLTFVNEETMTTVDNASFSNAGLSTNATLTNLYTTVAAGIPVVPTPAFKSVRTYADQLAITPGGGVFAVDPDIKQPRVHQVSVGISRELPWRTAAEARYVGTFGRGLWRGIDLNQMNPRGAFQDDFLRARSNGFLALQSSGAFDPAYNPALPGSQPLTVIPTLGGGFLTSASVRNLIQTGQVAALADLYETGAGPVVGAMARRMFLPNPGIYVADLIENGGFSNYNALQLELRRQLRAGVLGQINYTLSNTRTNSLGTTQERFEPFLDNARPQLDEGRSEFHVTHVMNANAVVDLPFGAGRRWLNRGGFWNWMFGDWQTGAIVHWQSGAPISILSQRGTFNRTARSYHQTARSSLSAKELKKLLGVRELDGILYWIDPKVIDPNTGRAVGPDTLANTPGFPDQVFFNPMAGEVGNLEILAFDGPSQFVTDVSISKRVRVWKQAGLRFRADIFNLFNTVNFWVADDDINSTTFGRIIDTTTNPRLIQLQVKVDF